ncbi:MAG: hypothetical protein HY783_01730 [Chloroflexi bacterium]|nr:hypothetical protein [Chloroflexota bacterium]
MIRTTRAVSVCVLFVFLTLAFTFPMGQHLGSAVEDYQDALLNVWITAWDGHQLLADPLRLFDANIFYPYPRTLAFSEIILTNALVSLPINLATGNPVLGYNLALLLSFVLSGFGMYLLAYRLTRRSAAGLVAGVFYAFNAYKLSNLAQVQLLSLHWLPFMLIFLDSALKGPWGDHKGSPRQNAASRGGRLPELVSLLAEAWPPSRPALLFALFLVLQSLSSFYYATFAALAAGLYILCFLFTSREATPLLALARLPVPLALASLATLPFARPYFQVQRQMGFGRTLADSEPFSASLQLWRSALPNNLLYGGLLGPREPVYVGGYPLDSLFPGFLILALATLGLLLALRRWRGYLFYLVLALLAFVLSLGPALYLAPGVKVPLPFALPYRWLYDLVPGFQALRAPLRFAGLAMLGLSVLAAFGAASLLLPALPGSGPTGLGHYPGARLARARQALGVLLVLAVALENLVLPGANAAPVPTGAQVPPVYWWLRQQAPRVILELPLIMSKPGLGLLNQYLSVYHWSSTPDGYSGFVPPRHGQVVYEMRSFPSERSVSLLRGLDVEYLVIHADRVEGWERMRQALESYGSDLPLVASFGPDLVYRVAPSPARAVVETRAYLPPQARAGMAYDAYLLILNRGQVSLVVKPTHAVAAQARWRSAGGQEVEARAQAFLPIVTSGVSVAHIPLQAPAAAGRWSLALSVDDPQVGHLEASQPVQVGQEPVNSPLPVPAWLSQVKADRLSYLPGDTVRVSGVWQARGKIDEYYSVFAILKDAEGRVLSRYDGEPQGGHRPTLLWTPGEAITDTWELTLPEGATPGKYTVEIGMYRAWDQKRCLLVDPSGNLHDQLGLAVKIPPSGLLAPKFFASKELGGQVVFVGFDAGVVGDTITVRPGEVLGLTLCWRAMKPLDKDYTVFVHLLAQDGQIAAQLDRQPLDGHYPTTMWDDGEVVADQVELRLPPALPRGQYRLAVGLYDGQTTERLQVPDGDGRIFLPVSLLVKE